MDLTQLTKNLKAKTDFDANSSFGLKDINSIVGIVDNSVTSLQALIFKNDDPKYDDTDPTNYDITGIRSGYDQQRAFVFDLKKDYKYTLSSDITDHYVEDNVAIQDHIGLRPIILEVTGVISEINLLQTANDEQKKPKGILDAENLKDLFNSTDSYVSRMGSLTSFAPNITNQALNIYNSAKYAYGMANNVMNLSKTDTSSSITPGQFEKDESQIKQTKQCFWVKWFTTQWQNRASFSIVTPYDVLKNMYIVELSATQPESTRYITNLHIKFKQIRQAVVRKKLCSCQQRNTQLSTEHGVIVRKTEYWGDNWFKNKGDEDITIDATPDTFKSIENSNNDFGGSKILNEGATYNTDKGTGVVSESKVKSFVSGLKNKFKNISSKTKYQQSQA